MYIDVNGMASEVDHAANSSLRAWVALKGNSIDTKI